jgi:hypothetical protein
VSYRKKLALDTIINVITENCAECFLRILLSKCEDPFVSVAIDKCLMREKSTVEEKWMSLALRQLFKS